MKPPKTKYKVDDKIWIADEKYEYIYGSCDTCEGAKTITVKGKEKNCRSCHGTGESKNSTKHTYYRPVSRKIIEINIRCDFEIHKKTKDNETEIDISYIMLDPTNDWRTSKREYNKDYPQDSLFCCFGSKEELLVALKKGDFKTAKPKQKKKKEMKIK